MKQRLGFGALTRMFAIVAAAIVVVGAVGCNKNYSFTPRLAEYGGVDGSEVLFLLPPVNVATSDAEYNKIVGVRRIVQETKDWCWAACAQMIHEFHGREVTQSELASKIHGEDVRTATFREIMIALCPQHTAPEIDALRETLRDVDWMSPEVSPVTFVTRLYGHFAANSDDIVDAMKIEHPVMVVLDETVEDLAGRSYAFEHGYVVRGVGYVETRTNRVADALSKGWEAVQSWLPADEYGARDRLIITAKAMNFNYGIAWVELVDPDPAAVESADENDANGRPRPPAIKRMSGEEFAGRVRVILTTRDAEKLLQSHSNHGFRAGGL